MSYYKKIYDKRAKRALKIAENIGKSFTIVTNVDPGRHITLNIDLGKTLKERLKNWQRLKDFVAGLPMKDVENIGSTRPSSAKEQQHARKR